MYQAFNENIIVSKPTETETESGIILAEKDEGSVFMFIVEATNELTKDLQGKTIYAPRHKVFELDPIDGKKLGALNYKEILAIK